MLEYSTVLIFIVIASIIASLIPAASYILGIKKDDAEKISIYECGFDPFADSRQKFEVRFFLVAILFIIFDLEVTFLFPWAVVLNKIGLFGFWSMMLFLIILTIGFIYEWRKGALDWESKQSKTHSCLALES